MKPGIHPTWYPDAVVICACGNTWTTGSTKKEIHTDVCSKCHPFFTGEQRIVDTAGQVERFMKRVSAKEQMAMTQPTVEDKKAKKEKRRSRKTIILPGVTTPADLPVATSTETTAPELPVAPIETVAPVEAPVAQIEVVAPVEAPVAQIEVVAPVEAPVAQVETVAPVEALITPPKEGEKKARAPRRTAKPAAKKPAAKKPATRTDKSRTVTKKNTRTSKTR